MPRTLLVSTRNSAYQVLESLRANRQKRHRSRAFLVEGVLPITRALAHGWTFEAVAFTPHVRLSAWASDVIARANPPVQYTLAPDLLRALSGKTESSELIAVVSMPDDDVRRIRVARNLLALVMDAPSSPGDLGTIVRSCDALGRAGRRGHRSCGRPVRSRSRHGEPGLALRGPRRAASTRPAPSSNGSPACAARSVDAWWSAPTRQVTWIFRHTTSRHRP